MDGDAMACQPNWLEFKVAQIFCQSKRYRDLTRWEIGNLSEEQARERFTLMRWGSTTVMPCPVCGAVDKHYVRQKRHQWRCKHCDAVFSVTTGTPFASRKLSFRQLLMLFYVFVTSPKGVSANQVHSDLGMTLRAVYQNLGKIREALWEQRDLTKLTGLVQIDGGHFCGKPRRPQKRQGATSAIVNSKLRNRKAGMVPQGKNSYLEPWNLMKLKNRRVVITIRQLSPEPRKGALRTITAIAMAEDRANVIPIIQKYVAKDATIQTDEGIAYSSLSAWYRHQTVKHSAEYSTDQGVNNNQAESFFGRMRRTEYGVHHGMRPQYLAFYANETAWREDCRFLTIGQKYADLTGKIFRSPVSKAWRGYVQGHKFEEEYIGV